MWWNNRTKGRASCPPCKPRVASNIAERDMRSKAPIPSTEIMVHRGPDSVSACRAWAMHSVPDLVDMAYLKRGCCNFHCAAESSAPLRSSCTHSCCGRVFRSRSTPLASSSCHLCPCLCPSCRPCPCREATKSRGSALPDAIHVCFAQR